jgi:hypothetical protein
MITPVIEWYDGNDEGWSDDLGIIAPDNTWISYAPAGWYIRWEDNDVIAWCKENLKSLQSRQASYLVTDPDDAILFMLRWS